jgi:hypothetical protein
VIGAQTVSRAAAGTRLRRIPARTRGRRRVALASAALCSSAALALLGGTAATSARSGAAARAAGSVKVDDHAALHLVKAAGSTLYEQGRSTGTLPGPTSVRMVIGSSITASFTISTHGGSISGSGAAKLKSSGRYASFGGSLSVAKGSGRYARAHGKGALYGVIDRRTHALTVTTVGTLYY